MSLMTLPQLSWDADSELGSRHSLGIYIEEAKSIERTKKGSEYSVSRVSALAAVESSSVT